MLQKSIRYSNYKEKLGLSKKRFRDKEAFGIRKSLIMIAKFRSLRGGLKKRRKRSYKNKICIKKEYLTSALGSEKPKGIGKWVKHKCWSIASETWTPKKINSAAMKTELFSYRGNSKNAKSSLKKKVVLWLIFTKRSTIYGTSLTKRFSN